MYKVEKVGELIFIAESPDQIFIVQKVFDNINFYFTFDILSVFDRLGDNTRKQFLFQSTAKMQVVSNAKLLMELPELNIMQSIITIIKYSWTAVPK